MQVDTGAYGKDGWLRGLRREAALRSGPLLRTIHRVEDVRYRLRHLLPVEIVTGDQSVRRIDYERAAQLAANRLDARRVEVFRGLGRCTAVFGTRIHRGQQLRSLRLVDHERREARRTLQRRGIRCDPHALHVGLAVVESRRSVRPLGGVGCAAENHQWHKGRQTHARPVLCKVC